MPKDKSSFQCVCGNLIVNGSLETLKGSENCPVCEEEITLFQKTQPIVKRTAEDLRLLSPSYFSTTKNPEGGK